MTEARTVTRRVDLGARTDEAIAIPEPGDVGGAIRGQRAHVDPASRGRTRDEAVAAEQRRHVQIGDQATPGRRSFDQRSADAVCAEEARRGRLRRTTGDRRRSQADDATVRSQPHVAGSRRAARRDDQRGSGARGKRRQEIRGQPGEEIAVPHDHVAIAQPRAREGQTTGGAEQLFLRRDDERRRLARAREGGQRIGVMMRVDHPRAKAEAG